jgi:PleD family two-component response regulator
MIIVAVDDLLLKSRIVAAGRQLGLAMQFATTPSDVFASARESAPSLIIFDLNSRVLDPLDTIATIKADPALHPIRTLGFVSHVDSDTIAAARTAGIDEVVARGAFMAHLPNLLQSGGRPDFVGE